MSKSSKRVSSKAGMPPGSLIHVGERKTDRVSITLMEFDGEHFLEKGLTSIEEYLPFKNRQTIKWINVCGLHEPSTVEAAGQIFGLHPLLLEDILHTGQRPKLEDYEDYLFVVLRMLTYDTEKQNLHSEQVSLIVGPRYVLCFEEQEGDVFDQLRARIRNGKGRIRKLGSDYLAYALMDAVVDQYFEILESFGEKIEDLQEQVLCNPTPDILQTIQATKRDMLYMRKSVWPLREVVGGLQRGESRLMGSEVLPFLRDIYDHTIQVVDTIETFRDMVSSTLDVYLSSVSNKMNMVMKVLTIIATIFIPLTFIVGVYGMNFKDMPELEWRWGYLAVWIVMIVAAVLMLWAFRRKKWL